MSTSDYKQLSDNQLVHKFSEGNKTERQYILTHIWERYHGYVLVELLKKYSNNLSEWDVEEALSDAYQKLPDILLSSPTIPNKSHNLHSLLLSMGAKRCTMRIREQGAEKRKVHHKTLDLSSIFKSKKDVQFPHSLHSIIEPSLEDSQKQELLTNTAKLALGLLSKQQCDCLVLIILRGYTYEQAARELGLNFSQVRGSMSNGKKRLRSLVSSAKHTTNTAEITDNQLHNICEQLQLKGNVQVLIPSLIHIALSLIPKTEAHYFSEHHIQGNSLIQMTNKFKDKLLRQKLLNAQGQIKSMLEVYLKIESI